MFVVVYTGKRKIGVNQSELMHKIRMDLPISCDLFQKERRFNYFWIGLP